MNPKKINTFHADIGDVGKNEVGEYYPYDNLPSKVGDLVILEIFPEFEDVMEDAKYRNEYPPDYLVLAEVVRFSENGGFFCKVLMEDSRLSTQTASEKNG